MLVSHYINVFSSRYSMEKEQLRIEKSAKEFQLHLIHEFCGKEEAKNINKVLRSREKL